VGGLAGARNGLRPMADKTEQYRRQDHLMVRDHSAALRNGSTYLLNFTCPDFPSAVLMVNVMVVPGTIGVFASPFSEFSP
jgi:hypothetical protein